jgi:soluble lytic murein transglycosylase-like protein
MKTLWRFLEYYCDLDREFELIDWALILFLAFVIGMLVTTEVNAQTKPEIERIIVQAANAHGVSPQLALAIADVESQMNPNMVGSLGEIGLFQLRPEYHRVVRGDVQANVNTAMRYLAQLQRDCGQYGDAFFVCYNYGPSRPLKYPRLFPYYKKVKQAMV